jgi:hypothetical protein
VVCLVDNSTWVKQAALENWIKSKAYKRHGKAITNFDKQLPAPQSKLA